MLAADLIRDGWCLDSGEDRHREAPDTFLIPSIVDRADLRVGDYAKLIFRIAVADEAEPEAVERMWVIVRERTSAGYLGVLNNDPYAIAENEELWSGVEIPFEPRHIIAICSGDEDSRTIASVEPTRKWPR